MNKPKYEAGSAHVIVTAVLVVVIVGLLGFIFWQNVLNKSADTTKKDAATSSSTTTKDNTEEAATVYGLSDAAKDISAVLKTQACGGRGYGDGITEANFNLVSDTDSFQYVGGKSIINTSFTYAYVQYGCGSSGSGALMKRDGAWKVISEDARIYPMCSAIQGQGFPRSIVDKCYINDTDTEAAAIQ